MSAKSPMGPMNWTESRFRVFPAFVVALLFLACHVGVGQSTPTSSGGTIRGLVRDAKGKPIVGASVKLQKQGASAITLTTDVKGAYVSSELHPGPYTISADKPGVGSANSEAVNLGDREVKECDLTLMPERSAPSHGCAEKPQFFDEPHFTVSGVTDTMSHGGHGSDTVSRTSQSLAKELAALTRNSPAISVASSTNSEEDTLRAAVDRDPNSFEANYRLGRHLADTNRVAEAIPFLERASRIKPEDYESSFLLARTYADAREYESASITAKALLSRQDKAELHHLLGDIEEKQKNPLLAVQEYQRAAELDPSEPNLFDWGAELLTHRTLQPAIQVFTKGNHLFPQSERMLLGLGVAWYATGSSDLAAKYVCQASDLEPSSHAPYIVLGKMQIADPAWTQPVLTRLERFARLQPDDALANYYYAVALWKGRQSPTQPAVANQVETLLEKAVRLDPKLAAGFLQLGVVYEDRGDMARSVASYQGATAADPQLAEAHYRLAQVYRRTRETQKAASEISRYNQLSRKSADDLEREAREIPQFDYTLRDTKSPARPQ